MTIDTPPDDRRPDLPDGSDWTSFLQWCLPQLRMRWGGFRKVRRQVCRRIRRRMEELNLPDIEAYRRRLSTHPNEWRVLDDLCRVSISRLYRDRRLFEFLSAEGLPALAAAAEGAPLRCWSAGCASGEEPYTLRILWDLEVGPRFGSVPLQIVATDADEHLLERAREASFQISSLKEVPDRWRQEAFVREGHRYRVRDSFRGGIEFLRQDLRQELPAGRFHLILCRNLVFTYYDQDLQRQILIDILSKLHPKGLLVLGSHESPPANTAALVRLPAAPWVYVKAAA